MSFQEQAFNSNFNEGQSIISISPRLFNTFILSKGGAISKDFRPAPREINSVSHHLEIAYHNSQSNQKLNYTI